MATIMRSDEQTSAERETRSGAARLHAPEVHAPEVHAPEVHAPEVHLPGAPVKHARLPDARLPDDHAAERRTPRQERAEPVWPGFPAARLITLVKVRGDARAAAALALLIIAATLAVIGAPHLVDAAEELGAALGIGLRASEIVR